MSLRIQILANIFALVALVGIAAWHSVGTETNDGTVPVYQEVL